MATGVRMPGLLYGTAWKKGATKDLVIRAVEAGFRGVDTACQPKHYNEEGVGQALTELIQGRGLPRGALFVQTKYTPISGQDPQRVPYDAKAPLTAQVEQSVAASLRNLNTPYIDSLVLHSPLRRHEDMMQVWGAMQRAHAAGHVLALGISNCYSLETLTRLHADATVKPSVVQNRFYAESGYDVGIRQFCADNGITYQSFWTLTANPHLLASDVVRAAAQRLACTREQVLFRALTQMGITPLTGTQSDVHMQQDLAIFDFELTPAEVDGVKALCA